MLLRQRRRKLDLSREAAAVVMDTSEHTVWNWEHGATPVPSSFPSIITFLGREPWAEPTSLRDKLLAARRRHGLTAEATAALLGVDPSTYWRWECGQRPHRLADRARCAEFIDEKALPRPATSGDDDLPIMSGIFDLAAALRERRKELGLTQKEAAATIGANLWSIVHWETNRSIPGDRFYPSLIRFLGREPWPEPRTTAERLRTARLRRGLTNSQAAAVLQVDETSISAWERGEGPHHQTAKAKVEAFITGGVRPFRKRKGRRASASPVQPL
jgi:transcriptional regulator with XRE-family HTH domain